MMHAPGVHYYLSHPFLLRSPFPARGEGCVLLAREVRS
jgi:hypothetical protein